MIGETLANRYEIIEKWAMGEWPWSTVPRTICSAELWQ